jgi:hypothetical protein
LVRGDVDHQEAHGAAGRDCDVGVGPPTTS